MIINVIAIVVIVGVIMWAVNTWLPMQQLFKNLLNLIVFIALIVWVMRVLGLIRF